MPQRAHRVLIPLAALLAVIPILIYGPSCGHDFDFHLVSWLEASTQFAHFGFPHWAYTPAWNAGEPRFIFYPPLSWTLGGMLGLILPWTLVPAVFTWICLTLSGFTAHRLASAYANPTTALLAATLYLANPYMLFTAYERTAYGELLAAAFLPLLFAAALAPRIRTLQIAIPIALLWLTNAPAAVMGCYALAFLTLARLALGAPSFRLHRKGGVSTAGRPSWPLGTPRLQPWLLNRPKKWPLAPGVCSPPAPTGLYIALTTLTGTILGLLLAAFYILPAAWERKYVQTDMAVTTGMRPADHFLFHRMTLNTPGFTTPNIAFHDAVVRTASLVSLTLLAAIALAFVLILTLKKPVILSGARSAKSKNPDEARPTSTVSPFQPRIPSPLIPLLALTLLIAFLLTPPSQFLWRITPQLHFLQFPWRLCALLAVILCILASQAVSLKLENSKLMNHSLPPGAPQPALSSPKVLASEMWARTITVFALAAALILPAWHFFHQPCDDEDNVKARVALFHSNRGTEPTDEYTPTNANPDALRPNNPPYWLAGPCFEFGGCDASRNPPPGANPGPAPDQITLTVPSPQTLIINRRAYPGWHITLNGRTVSPPVFMREDDLIALSIPPGTDTINLHFDETPDRLIALFISGTTAAFTIFLTLKRRRKL